MVVSKKMLRVCARVAQPSCSEFEGTTEVQNSVSTHVCAHICRALDVGVG